MVSKIAVFFRRAFWPPIFSRSYPGPSIQDSRHLEKCRILASKNILVFVSNKNEGLFLEITVFFDKNYRQKVTPCRERTPLHAMFQHQDGNFCRSGPKWVEMRWFLKFFCRLFEVIVTCHLEKCRNLALKHQSRPKKVIFLENKAFFGQNDRELSPPCTELIFCAASKVLTSVDQGQNESKNDIFSSFLGDF